MRLLIVAALFLIFSAACASPVYIAARGLPYAPMNWGPFVKLSDLKFQGMRWKSQPVLLAEFDGLARIRYEGANYQLLSLKKVPNRKLGKELSRFKHLIGKELLGVRQFTEVEHRLYDYFLFEDGTFSLEPLTKKELDSLWKDAGSSYGDMWPNMGPENKDPNNFICARNDGEPKMAVYMSGIIRYPELLDRDPPTYSG